MKKILLLIALISFGPKLIANDLEGPYIGLHTGYLHGFHRDIESYVNAAPDWCADKLKPKSLVYGMYAGFNKAVNNLLYGIEADAETLTAHASTNGHTIGSIDDGYPIRVRYKHTASLRARLGYILNQGSTLLFVTAGRAYARTCTEFFNEAGTSVSDRDTRNLYGWTTGFGIEQLLNEKFSIKAEYRYSTYDSFLMYNTTYSGGSPETPTYDKLISRNNSVRVGISYHF